LRTGPPIHSGMLLQSRTLEGLAADKARGSHETGQSRRGHSPPEYATLSRREGQLAPVAGSVRIVVP